MALNYNKVILSGRLTSDVEVKVTQSAISVCSFTIAVNRRTKAGEQQEADFFNCTAWRGAADFLGKYGKKGTALFIEGRIQNRQWTDKDGKKHTVTEIVADEVSFVESKRDESGQAAPVQFQTPASKAPKFEEIKTDDDLPF